ncbi:hypothetical protein DLAC_09896 [Tieghemostelium lacteum]|uniref:Uncharacterized protein n=1 Tax=Tieghemostelium lacteum TaxID=361077 RepID=A0A151Z5L4_TIELA|nr:hypothetical protein DLAC_09896 [Tieghemostelium lacteum]|eukprot:KYQ89241.1 hypothetical protein DLAC_09896 [Tieghemostelium lacteum]
MKSVLLILSVLFVFTGLVYSQDCSTLGACVEEGGKCTGANTTPLAGPDYGSIDGQILMCSSGLYCRFPQPPITLAAGDFGVCTPIAQVGDLCDDETTCTYGAFCYNPSNESPMTCQWGYYATLNESCTTSMQCVHGLECDVEESMCVVDRENLNDDTVCSQDSHCLSNQYCDTTANDNNGACVSTLATGADCTRNTQCKPTDVCGGSSADTKCTPAFSTASNGDCTDDSECDISSSLTCTSGKCTAINFTPSSTNCSDTTSCSAGSYESCQCSGNSGVCKSTFYSAPAECKSSLTSFLTCLNENNCATIFSGQQFVAPDSCAYDNCGSEFCDLASNCQHLGSTCVTEPLAATICTSSSSILSASVATIFVVLLAIFF